LARLSGEATAEAAAAFVCSSLAARFDIVWDERMCVSCTDLARPTRLILPASKRLPAAVVPRPVSRRRPHTNAASARRDTQNAQFLSVSHVMDTEASMQPASADDDPRMQQPAGSSGGGASAMEDAGSAAASASPAAAAASSSAASAAAASPAPASARPSDWRPALRHEYESSTVSASHPIAARRFDSLTPQQYKQQYTQRTKQFDRGVPLVFDNGQQRSA
jgi:hypothetical protein